MDNTNKISVRELELRDIDLINNYWHNSDPDFLEIMGVDLQLLPSRKEFSQMLSDQIKLPYNKKNSYALIWLLDEIPVGHSNVNKIEYGNNAFMHLHLWNIKNRHRGLGVKFVKLSIPYYFKNLNLKTLYCEPSALNQAPNKTLSKIGFEFEKEYKTFPGSINFKQLVKRWKLTKEIFEKKL